MVRNLFHLSRLANSLTVNLGFNIISFRYWVLIKYSVNLVMVYVELAVA